jgi:hypothetical protein
VHGSIGVENIDSESKASLTAAWDTKSLDLSNLEIKMEFKKSEYAKRCVFTFWKFHFYLKLFKSKLLVSHAAISEALRYTNPIILINILP